MKRPSVTDEMLMAYADGELTQAGRESVERALAEDPALKERLDIFSRTRMLSQKAVSANKAAAPSAAFEKRMARLVAKSARARGAGSNVVAFGRSSGSGGGWSSLRLPLAASVALAIGIAGGYFGRDFIQPTNAGPGFAALATPQVFMALDEVAMGDNRSIPGIGTFHAIASFRDPANTLCREFEITAAEGAMVVAVACNAGGGWDPRFATAAPKAGKDYQPASAMEALSAFLEASGAGAPLSADEEKSALAAVRSAVQH